MWCSKGSPKNRSTKGDREIVEDGTSGYRIYCQAPGETALTVLQTLGVVFEYTDQTDADGDYLYAVAALREANGQASGSMSPPVLR